MPLLNFREVRPWASAIRTAVLRGEMPPWPAEDGLAFEGSRLLSAREIDVIADWAGGGAPEGSEGVAAARVRTPAGGSGPPERDPSLRLQLSESLEEGQIEAATTTSIPSISDGERWISSWEFRAGNPEIVHDAVIILRPPGGPRQLLGAWTPGQIRAVYPPGAGWRLPEDTGAEISIRYRRPFLSRPRMLEDRSELAFWFHERPPAARVRSVSLAGRSIVLDTPVRLLAITRLGGSGPFSLVAQPPVGLARLLLAGRTFDEAWPIQYRLAEPLELAAGTQVAHEEPVEEVWLELLDAK